MFFHILETARIAPSWKFIQIGLNFIDYNYRLKPEDVFEYAAFLLNEGAAEKELIEPLLLLNDRSELNHLVCLLSDKEASDYKTENRKWIWYVLTCFFETVSKDLSVDDLFCLGDLWGYLGYPTHYPWNVRENDYVKCRDIKEMIQVHKEWLAKEALELQRA